MNNKIQILFSGGGGLNGALYLGISQFIYEKYELHKYANNIYIGGLSVIDIYNFDYYKHIHNKFTTDDDFAFSIYGTTLLPFIGKSIIAIKNNWHQLHLDGGLSTTIPHKDELNDIPTIYFNRLIMINPQNNITHININDWIPFNFKHLLLSTDENDYIELYNLGYNKAKENSELLDNFFIKYLHK